MQELVVAALAATVWCLAPLPLAVAIGRAFSHGHTPGHAEQALTTLAHDNLRDCAGGPESDRTHFHL
ncbi:MAG: hypothetical protein ABF306_03925 [Nocardioides marinisabuli]|uniref:hypothetical protein n=1 Tax=Nocardioides marinisabuli TaxID=419476 RepID=UPI00321AA8AB